MNRLIALCLCLTLTACAGIAPAQQPAPLAAPPTPPAAVQQAATPPDQIQLNVPNWPVFAYQLPDQVIVVLIVKDPATFPVPGSFTFKPKNGGTEVKVPMLRPDIPAEKPK